jgi:hypothetical protein
MTNITYAKTKDLGTIDTQYGCFVWRVVLYGHTCQVKYWKDASIPSSDIVCEYLPTKNKKYFLYMLGLS